MPQQIVKEQSETEVPATAPPPSMMNVARSENAVASPVLDKLYSVWEERSTYFQARALALTKSNEGLEVEALAQRRVKQVAVGRLEALANTLRLLALEPVRDNFISQVLKSITEHIGAQEGGFWLYDPVIQSCYLHLDYYEAQSEDAPENLILPLIVYNQRKISRAFPHGAEQGRLNKITLYSDVANAPELAHCRADLLERRVQTLVLIPLFLEGQFIGIFSICSTYVRTYLSEDMEVAQALAQQAVLAVQMARVAEQSRLSAVLEERNRLAREIHDTLAQAFTGMLIHLGVAQRIAQEQPKEAWDLITQIAELARQGLGEARRSVWALQPESLESSDLAHELPRMVEQMTLGTTVQQQVYIHGEPYRLTAETRINMYRIAQEALNNAIRHGQAQTLFAELTFTDEQIRLCIQDDGRGFDAERQKESGGFGLIGMRQRAERMRGQLTIISAPGVGTEVVVVIPKAGATPQERQQ